MKIIKISEQQIDALKAIIDKLLLSDEEVEHFTVDGAQLLQNGTYSPRHTKRYYFKDEMVEQLHATDRVLQSFLLKLLKPTFKHINNLNF